MLTNASLTKVNRCLLTNASSSSATSFPSLWTIGSDEATHEASHQVERGHVEALAQTAQKSNPADMPKRCVLDVLCKPQKEGCTQPPKGVPTQQCCCLRVLHVSTN